MRQPRVPSLPALLLVLRLASGTALARTSAADAEGLVDAGRYAEATRAHERAVEADPDDARAHVGLARAQLAAAANLPLRSQQDRDAAAKAEALRERLP